MISLEMDLVDPQSIRENLCNRRDKVASEFLRTQRSLLAGRSVVNTRQAEEYLSGLENDLNFMGRLIEGLKPRMPLDI